MSPETQNFDQLRRLLVLKRYEQPPPGYFNTFSSTVIARIEAGERADDPVGFVRFIWEGVWLQKVWDAIEAKPALAGVFGAAVCGFLIAGVIYTDSPERMKSPLWELTAAPQADDGGLKVAANPISAPSPLGDFSSQSGVVPVHTVLNDMPQPGVTQPFFKLVGDN